MKFTNIKKGEVLSSTMYLTVLDKDKDSIKVRDLNGQQFTVKGDKLIEQSMRSAAQFDQEVKVNKTEAAEKLINAGDTAFTVVFNKADGTERTLVGTLIDTENHMGRSNVTDLQVTTGNPLRQVDHRTIKSLVLRGTKYVVK